ncbi:hypothetical protein HPB49_012938 [Dermacentor silvarum]|uniref:Uncharacterized protein n=1 Tax=Dermacentor silvarum TaxID=543639 RepID=A0ACB8CF95_DERSI|nr:hypothetical protein HPB49_012938 [Dermacentor silvarum]
MAANSNLFCKDASENADVVLQLNFEKFLQSGEHADVEFVVQPEKFDMSKNFKAHKQLLALSSEVFEAMFYGRLAEKDTVVITDLHPDGFYGLLKYVYAGQARIENCFEALHTKAAAEKYLFPELTTACLAYLRKHIDASEALLVLDCAVVSGYGSLDKVAEAVLVNTSEDVLGSDAFLNSLSGDGASCAGQDVKVADSATDQPNCRLFVEPCVALVRLHYSGLA